MCIRDSHEIVRLGLKALLSRYPHFEVIAEARDAQEALEQLSLIHISEPTRPY